MASSEHLPGLAEEYIRLLSIGTKVSQASTGDQARTGELTKTRPGERDALPAPTGSGQSPDPRGDPGGGGPARRADAAHVRGADGRPSASEA